MDSLSKIIAKYNSPKVVVAMSGGVDSSVAAAILASYGFEVIGIGLDLRQNHKGGSRACCGDRDMLDARRVAQSLNIPFYVLNFRNIFAETVIDYARESYLRGETPNPCVVCNEKIKFSILLGIAEALGAPLLATGHYARIATSGGRLELRRAEHEKDQSYFLWPLSQEKLAKVIFPLGEIKKGETRKIARELGLKVHSKPESQDLCFDIRSCLEIRSNSWKNTNELSGPIKDEEGKEIGTHKGIQFYTIGQRKGLGLGLPEAHWVTNIDLRTRTITVSKKRPAARKTLLLEKVNYVSIEKPSCAIEVEAVTRYRKPPVQALLFPLEGEKAAIDFNKPEEPVSPGQSVVLYAGDTVLAGGVVSRQDSNFQT